MNEPEPLRFPPPAKVREVPIASELNNLLQIIGGTTDLLENIWHGAQHSEHYLAMLRFSVDRAARVTAHMVEQAGGATGAVYVRCGPPAGHEIESSETPSQRTIRVMLVDDEPLTLGLFQQQLETKSYAVVTAQNSFKALDALTMDPEGFDLVVLDYSMPFMDGQETFHRMRTIAPDLPVMIATGFIKEEILDSMFAAGLAGFIRKPLPPDEFLAQVEDVLGKKGALAQASLSSGIAAAI